jgi:hypothetical protein
MKKKTIGKRKLSLKKTAIVPLNGKAITQQQAAAGTALCNHPTTTVIRTFDC